MIDYYNVDFQMAGEWLKVIILHYFRKMSYISFLSIKGIYKK